MPDTVPTGESGGTTAVVTDSGSPSTAVPSESSPAHAKVGPDGPTVTDSKGPVPYERFEDINTRYNSLKWAEEHDPDRVRQQAQFFQWLDRDPEGAFQYMESYLQRVGALKPRNDHGHATPNNDGRPQPDIVVPETGQKFYSAEAAEKLAQWAAEQRIKPIEERLGSFEADRQRSHAQAQAAQLLAEAETWPHYKEHESAILKEMERDHRLSLEGAYRRVVMPKIRELERQSLLAEIHQKSQATTHNPAASTPTQNLDTSKMSWSEVFKREMAKRRA